MLIMGINGYNISYFDITNIENLLKIPIITYFDGI